MRYCSRCVLPATRPNLVLDESGLCNACRAFDLRQEIDWDCRKDKLARLAEDAIAKHGEFDCLIPVSGGKDSTWQVGMCLDLGLRPLAVTWRPPGRTSLGQQNLENLVRLGVTHIDWTANPKIERHLIRRAFEEVGSPGTPMHLAIYGISFSIAAKFQIPLIVFGENSAFEYGGQTQDFESGLITDEWLMRYGVRGSVDLSFWEDETVSADDLVSYRHPSIAELEKNDIRAIFLGHFVPWDPNETKMYAERLGFHHRPQGPHTGIYDFADIDDTFMSVHHWLKWYKFGFTRDFDNLSLEIRHKRLSRDDALIRLNQEMAPLPETDLEVFCDYLGITMSEAMSVAERFRNKEIWSLTSDKRWYIPDFILTDWTW